MEMMAGEAGVLRTALGVVLGMEGIDARVGCICGRAVSRM